MQGHINLGDQGIGPTCPTHVLVAGHQGTVAPTADSGMITALSC
jgi:hypothetical protein